MILRNASLIRLAFVFCAADLLYTSRLRDNADFCSWTGGSRAPHFESPLESAWLQRATNIRRWFPGCNIAVRRRGLREAKPKIGLRAWMERVLEECDRAAAGFEADPVHDLRVALRRCRSLADGLMALDTDPSWKDMKKAGKKTFPGLGELRDMQVMQEWIEKLGFAEQGAETSTGRSSRAKSCWIMSMRARPSASCSPERSQSV